MTDPQPLETTLPPAAPVQAPPPPRDVPLTFTGSGGEYFRIWIVNLALSVVTLGIYSAWAKVQKLQYFAANTQVDGSSLQFHGRPWAILRGRLLVVAFMAIYSLVGRVSPAVALVVLAAGALLYPWMLTLALRFRLGNTSWRGVRLGFSGTVTDAYRAISAAIGAWLLFIIATPRATPGHPPGGSSLLAFGLGALLFMAVLPLAHAQLIRFRVGGTRLGRLQASYSPSVGYFYGLYAKTFFLGVLGVVLLSLGSFWTAGLMRSASDAADPGSAATTYALVVGVGAAIVYALLAGYFFARQQVIVWRHTSAPGLTFRSAMTAGEVIGLGFTGAILTALTLGLYWPWFAVRFHRYQLGCLRIEADAAFDVIAAAPTQETTAAGDSAVDLLGWDFGW